LNILFFAFLTVALVFLAWWIGRDKGMLTVAIVMAVAWLAAVIGWIAGEWVGILAITMPSFIVLIAGLMALPPFVLPVPPLPWKIPTILATLYTAVWLVGTWTGGVAMDAIGLILYLQGLFLIFRPAVPIEEARPAVANTVLIVYGVTVFGTWRLLHAFELNDTRNLLILVQGLLVLSTYMLPLADKGKRLMWWFLGLFFAYGYLTAMMVERIDFTVTNVLVSVLGVVAFLRFLVADKEGPRNLVVAGLFLLYGLLWMVGIVTGDLSITPLWYHILIFAIGTAAIFMPLFVGPARNWEGFKALITYNLGRNYPYHVVPFRELVTRAEGNPGRAYLAGPGIVMTNADHVALLYKAGGFRRVIPPGFNFTYQGEKVQEVVDLRTQTRGVSVQATTKDGIEVTAGGGLAFRVATGGEELELGHSYPYSPVAVHKVIHTQRVGQADEQKQGWDQLVVQAAQQAIRDFVAEYTLDELSGLQDSGRDPKAEISSRMRDRVRSQVAQWGIEFLGGGVGKIQPPEEVMQERIDQWKSHWIQKIEELKAEAYAEELRSKDKVRAQAQTQMIIDLTEVLEQASELEPEQLERIMALHLLEAIGQSGERELHLSPPIEPSTTEIEKALLLTAVQSREKENDQ
jgi:regulator of protease activity HflC (stomatin/prohibitin superfamily)